MKVPDDPRFDVFFEHGYVRIVSAVALVTGDRDVAAEAVAEAVARAWEHVRKGREIDSLEAWIRTVALNCARRTFRRRAAETRATDRLLRRTPKTENAAESAPIDITAALAGLSRREREVAVMRFMLELDTAEIAQELGLSAGTVENYLTRARSKIAHAMRLNVESTMRIGGDLS